MEGQPEQARRYEQIVLRQVRRQLLDEERRKYKLSIGDWYEIVVEYVELEEHEGEDVIVVLFRMTEDRSFGPLYGFSMQAVEPSEPGEPELENLPASILEGAAEGWATIVLANLSEAISFRRHSGRRDFEGIVWL